MRLIPPAVHRALDLVTVAVFALAPILLHLSGPPAILSYTLAAVHMLLTLATRFPDVGRRPVALELHGWVELVVGVVLLLLPWVAGWTGHARAFYTAMGVIILVVWALSRYQHVHAGE